MPRELQPWGGEVHLPTWIRRALRRPAAPGDTPERVHEARQPQDPKRSVAQNVDQAFVGPLSSMYAEGRRERQARRRKHD